jgi:hypothetical protein
LTRLCSSSPTENLYSPRNAPSEKAFFLKIFEAETHFHIKIAHGHQRFNEILSRINQQISYSRNVFPQVFQASEPT